MLPIRSLGICVSKDKVKNIYLWNMQAMIIQMKLSATKDKDHEIELERVDWWR